VQTTENGRRRADNGDGWQRTDGGQQKAGAAGTLAIRESAHKTPLQIVFYKVKSSSDIPKSHIPLPTSQMKGVFIMKIGIHHIVIIILLVVCTALLGWANFGPKKPQGKAVEAETPMDTSKDEVARASEKSGVSHLTTIEIIMRRKSVRTYKDYKTHPIPKETLLKIVKAGMAAPTAVNRQPWEFVVITDRATLDRLADRLPYAKMLYKAPAAIAVCGVPKRGLPGKANEYWVQDCSAASENILLAVESLGLGAVWTGAYPIKAREDDIRKVLNIPNDIIPLNVIVIGHPTGKEKPKNKYKPKRIHWEKW